MAKSEKITKEHDEHKPKREFKASVSKDGRFWIFKDITTHIVSRSYLEKAQLEGAFGQGRSGTNKVDTGNGESNK